MPLWSCFKGRSVFDPHHVTTKLKLSLSQLEQGVPGAHHKVEKRLNQVLDIVQGQDPSSRLVAALAHHFRVNNIFRDIIAYMHLLHTQERVNAAHIFVTIFRREIDRCSPTVEYLRARPESFMSIYMGCFEIETNTAFTRMMHECIAHERLVKILYEDERFYLIFTHAFSADYTICVTALELLEALLVRQRMLTAKLMKNNYERVFKAYNKLMDCSKYIVRREALRLLPQFLIHPFYQEIMVRYVGDLANLERVTKLMTHDPIENIQIESFHCFKLFLVNPLMPKDIKAYLIEKREQIVDFIEEFDRQHGEGANDFDEHKCLLHILRGLK
ncbi:unnamed protein product, partial [Mesorhabditis spiculigera]